MAILYWLGLAIAIPFLFLNRVVAQIGVGPVYLFDVLLIVAALINPSAAIQLCRRPGFLALMILSVFWLVQDLANPTSGASTQLTLRRFAMAVYMLAPLAVFAFGRTIIAIFDSYPISATALLVGCQAAFATQGASPIVASVFLAALSATYLARDARFSMRVCIFSAGSLTISSGVVIGDGIFRTPLMVLIVGLLCVYVGHPSLSRRLAGRGSVVALALGGTALSILAVTYIPEVQRGLDGIVHWRDYIDTPELAAAASSRSRGDAGGTIATRIAFWDSIIESGRQDGAVLALGHGHSLSFFERLRPMQDFVDPELLEPHNSYLGLFYRYGLAGLIGFFAYLWGIMRDGLKESGAAYHCAQYACAAVAGTYAFFEVALEGPFGAFTFWLCLLTPRLVALERPNASVVHSLRFARIGWIKRCHSDQ